MATGAGIKSTPRFYEAKNIIEKLHDKGYQIELVGHSLGSTFSRSITEDLYQKIHKTTLLSEPKQYTFENEPPHISEKITRYHGKKDYISRGIAGGENIIGKGAGHELPTKKHQLRLIEKN